MSFFKKVGNALGKAAKTVTKVTGKVLKTAAPVAAMIPGIGTAVAGAASVVGEVLSPTKQEAIIEAVQDQGVVKVDKIENTILQNNPNIDSATLQVATQQMTKAAVAAAPDAKVDDSKALTDIPTTTKIIQWVKSNILLVAGGAVALFLVLKGKGGRRRRW
ncbi:hypothetical protein [Dysgonomonas sp. 520]|uniref:hypothetical protein n=1 Tax=Dysgonomonas sp. 520 TaxID=2302931 RepID=UPI001C86A35D|nr:hypothetical protein [Dysgonomonas sp. 520]NDW09065.1 hypothetical protein [Dysgonomonas sp. 520]